MVKTTMLGASIINMAIDGGVETVLPGQPDYHIIEKQSFQASFGQGKLSYD
jgi:hypothetical protein